MKTILLLLVSFTCFAQNYQYKWNLRKDTLVLNESNYRWEYQDKTKDSYRDTTVNKLEFDILDYQYDVLRNDLYATIKKYGKQIDSLEYIIQYQQQKYNELLQFSKEFAEDMESIARFQEPKHYNRAMKNKKPKPSKRKVEILNPALKRK